MEKKKPSKPSFSIFETAIKETKGKSAAKNKEVVNVKGLETKLLEFEFLKDELADTEAKISIVENEIKQISKEKFIELYKQKKRNPNTFYLKDGEGCVMVIPMDKYTKIKEQERADDLIDRYGEDAVTIDRNFYLNPDVLERNRAVIEKLIYEAKNISETDKRNLLVEQVTYTVRKGFIDDLLPYGNKMQNVMDDIQPVIALKNCGGKMADGGVSDESELISFVYDDYDAEVGSSVSSMYDKGGMLPTIDDVREYGKLIDSQMIDEGYVSNAGEQEFYDYKGKKYVITIWNDRAEEHEDGEEEIQLWMADGGINNEYFSKQASMKGGIAYYSVDINTESGDEIRDLEFKSYSEAREVYEKYKKSMKYNGKTIEDIQLVCVYKNGDYDSIGMMALGGIFGDSRYNSGRSWHLDRARHNQKESYEKPLKYRKRRRYGSGGM